jgi:hypothetical protein
VTSVHSCVRWCFALKGQCHKIFCFRFFSLINLPQVSKKSANLLHLWTFRMCGNLRICDLQTQYFMRFADPNLLQTYNFRKSANSLFFCLQIHI